MLDHCSANIQANAGELFCQNNSRYKTFATPRDGHHSFVIIRIHLKLPPFIPTNSKLKYLTIESEASHHTTHVEPASRPF